MKIVEPDDGWGVDEHGDPIVPRRWQSDCLPKVLAHYRKPNPSRGVIHAVTGSGKSQILAQLAACIRLDPGETLVISTSRQSLVRQIKNTVKLRLEDPEEFMARPKVGAYYTKAKDVDTNVVVCCNNSMGDLADALHRNGRMCAYFICDELHKSENRTMLNAYSKLLPRYSLGLSATPFRPSEKQGISNFDEVIYKYGISDALDDKTVIVPWRVVNWEGPETDRDSACVAMMLEQQDGYGLCNSDNISDAIQFAENLKALDYPCEVVHSELPDAENDRILASLKSGEYKAVIYVDLLSEGVDLPFCKFLCLRRVVGSRNRFIQELGRGIRYYKNKVTGEEKTHLTVLDPHQLIDSFSLDYNAVLSGDFDPDEAEVEQESEGKQMERSLQQECFNALRAMTVARAGKEPPSVAALASYLSQLVSVFDVFKLIEKKISAREWRRAPASEKQIQAMQGMKCWLSRGCVPSIHRTALEALTGMGTYMNRGTCSDLISIEASLAEKKQWPKFSHLDQIARQGLERHEKRKAGGSVAAMTCPRTSPFLPTTAVQPKIEQALLFEDLGLKSKK